jgi:hypothetical protein
MQLTHLKSIFGYLFFSAVVYSMLATYGCSSGAGEAGEGRIVYKVTIEGEDMDPMMSAMMPSEITTHFKGSTTATVISMGMGMMETRMISDAAGRNYSTLISAMGKKVAMVLNGELVDRNFADRVPLKVRITDEKMEIAGMNCIKAVITDSTQNTYDVYYTESLGKGDYNWSTPYREIKGMLMDYSIRFDNVVMRLTAKEIIMEPSDTSVFSVPEGYQIITDPDEMSSIFG